MKKICGGYFYLLNTRTNSFEGICEEPNGRLKLQKSRIDKYGTALFALLSFFVEGSSAISTASAIILHSPFGHIFGSGKTPSLRTRAGAAVIDKCD